MKGQGILLEARVRAAAMSVAAGAAFLLAMPGHAQAPSPAKPAGGADAAGAVIVPPVTDPGMAKQAPPMPATPAVKPPPMNVDPEAVRKPHPKGGADGAAGKAERSPSGHPSGKDQCKGPAELCRQDSAR